jgi:hypothetical protein
MKFIITGRVHPERADIKFGPIEWTLEDDGHVTAQCDSSQITVSLDLKSIDGWRTAFVTGEHFAHIAVGALGFSLGSGYSVELIQVTEESGVPHVFGVRPVGDSADDWLGFTAHEPTFLRCFDLANHDVLFRLALRDYLRAITATTDCAFYCYRAIEAIKSAFEAKIGGEGWQAMHTTLGTSGDAITSVVKTFADPVRHGNWLDAKPTDSKTRWEMLKLTRDVLTKYIDHSRPERPGNVADKTQDAVRGQGQSRNRRPEPGRKAGGRVHVLRRGVS